MACFNPLLAVDNGVDPETGKHRIKILPKRSDLNLEKVRERYGNNLMMLPCGHCVACAQDYARTWQARIMCEALYHEKKCFLTLTYKDAPENPSKEDLREFIKKLRNKFGKGLKFFAAGEKGSVTRRSHYHMILFGEDFAFDRQVMTKRGLNLVYGSSTLDSLWKHGFTSIGCLDVASAGYVSKYCDKKKISSQDDGEFVMMSRGLGRQFFEDNGYNLFDSDFVYFDGNKFKIPRYFLKLANEHPDFYTRLLAMDYADRKRAVANAFRYDKNRSVNVEEEGMIAAASNALAKKQHQEGDVRDVL